MGILKAERIVANDREEFYKTLVLVLLEPDDTGQTVEKIQYYKFNEGERLIEAATPSNYVRPRWDGEAWVEGAIPEEIAAWEQEHLAPSPPMPTLKQQQFATLTLTQAQQDATIDQQVDVFVTAGWISAEQAAEITGEQTVA